MGCVSVTAYEPCPLEEGCLEISVGPDPGHGGPSADHTTLDDLLQGRIQTEGEMDVR